MTTLDDLPFHDGQESPPTANGAKGAKSCRRHDWDRSLVNDLGVSRCNRCGVLRNEDASRRGRNNSKRGKAIQRKRIEGLGGLNLAGNNENLDGIGAMFAYESKSGASFSERYWRWLSGIPVRGDQVRVLIVTDTPGHGGGKARSVVVVEYDDWRDLHGELP